MKPILIAALLFSNVAYGQLNPDNNTSGNNVSKQHMQQREHQQKIIQKQQYEQKTQRKQIKEPQRQHIKDMQTGHQDLMLELQKSNRDYGIKQ